MYYTQTRPLSPPLITFAQMQSQLRIVTVDEQQYITDLVSAATEYAEQALDSSLLTRTITAVYTLPQVFALYGASAYAGAGNGSDFPSNWLQGQRFFLPRGPVPIGAGGITSAIDFNGKALTFTQDRGGLNDYLVLTPGQSFTAPLTIVPVAGLEKVSAGGVLSTRVVTVVEVVALPATSVATTRRS